MTHPPHISRRSKRRARRMREHYARHHSSWAVGNRLDRKRSVPMELDPHRVPTNSYTPIIFMYNREATDTPAPAGQENE